MASSFKANPSGDFSTFSSMLPSHARSTDSAARLEDISDIVLDGLDIEDVLHIDQLFLLTTEVLLFLSRLLGTALPVRDHILLALEPTLERADVVIAVFDLEVEASKLALQLVDLVAQILVSVVQVLDLVAQTLILIALSVRAVSMVFVWLALRRIKASERLTGGYERHLRVSVLLLYCWVVCRRKKERGAVSPVRCGFASIFAKIWTADESNWFLPSTLKRSEIPTLPGRRGAVSRLSLAFPSIIEDSTGRTHY